MLQLNFIGRLHYIGAQRTVPTATGQAFIFQSAIFEVAQDNGRLGYIEAQASGTNLQLLNGAAIGSQYHVTAVLRPGSKVVTSEGKEPRAYASCALVGLAPIGVTQAPPPYQAPMGDGMYNNQNNHMHAYPGSAQPPATGGYQPPPPYPQTNQNTPF